SPCFPILVQLLGPRLEPVGLGPRRDRLLHRLPVLLVRPGPVLGLGDRRLRGPVDQFGQRDLLQLLQQPRLVVGGVRLVRRRQPLLVEPQPVGEAFLGRPGSRVLHRSSPTSRTTRARAARLARKTLMTATPSPRDRERDRARSDSRPAPYRPCGSAG